MVKIPVKVSLDEDWEKDQLIKVKHYLKNMIENVRDEKGYSKANH